MEGLEEKYGNAQKEISRIKKKIILKKKKKKKKKKTDEIYKNIKFKINQTLKM